MGQKLCFFEGSDLVAMPKKATGSRKTLNCRLLTLGVSGKKWRPFIWMFPKIVVPRNHPF